MISLAFSSQAKELIFIDQLTADVKICCQVNRTLTHHYKLIIHLWVFKLKSGNFISFTYADLLGSLFQRGWGTLSLSLSLALSNLFFFFFWELSAGSDGILSEARWLLDSGLLPNSNSATRAIGYRQVYLWYSYIIFQIFKHFLSDFVSLKCM